MLQAIYVNLPVADLDRSAAFYLALGFKLNEKYSNDVGKCVVISDSIFVMLLTHAFFSTFTTKPIADARKTSEVLLCLDCDSRARVDELVRLALAAGGSAPRPPQEHDPMYGHGFEDPDGHIWELVFMNTSAS